MGRAVVGRMWGAVSAWLARAAEPLGWGLVLAEAAPVPVGASIAAVPVDCVRRSSASLCARPVASRAASRWAALVHWEERGPPRNSSSDSFEPAAAAGLAPRWRAGFVLAVVVLVALSCGV